MGTGGIATKKLKQERGSITLEASIMVPLFVIIMLLVNGLFILFMGQQVMSSALVQSAKSMAFDPYVPQRFAEDGDLSKMIADLFTIGKGNYISTDAWYEEDGDLETVAKERFLSFIRSDSTKAEALLKHFGVKDGAAGIDFSESSVEDGVLTLQADYVQEFVFNAAGLASFDRSLSVQVKLFEYREIEREEDTT